jgi:hypothetical protein
MNINTGEMRALTDQVERLAGLVQDHQVILIRAIAALLPDDGPRPKRERYLRAVEDPR